MNRACLVMIDGETLHWDSVGLADDQDGRDDFDSVEFRGKVIDLLDEADPEAQADCAKGAWIHARWLRDEELALLATVLHQREGEYVN